MKKDRFLYEVALMYYENDMTQDMIAKNIGCSRQKVQRLLSSAKKEGIVQISLVDPTVSYRETEEKLEKLFSLKKVIVVAGGIESEKVVRRSIGRAAAQYLEKTHGESDIIGLGWGRTVYEVVESVNYSHKKPNTVVPLVGGVGQVDSDFQVNELVKKFADKSGGVPIPFYVPALVDNMEIADILVSDQNIDKVVKTWEKINIAIIGIGGPLLYNSHSPSSYFNDTDIELLEKEGSVGDILSYFMRKDGTLLNSKLSKKVIGIKPDQLKKVNRVIAVAGSSRKADSILAALKARYINVLVTDNFVAEYILQKCG